MAQFVHSSLYIELEIEASGVYTPEIRENDGYYEAARGELKEVTGIIALGDNPNGSLKRVDLLEGVDPKSDTYKRIIQNVIDAFGDDLDAVIALADVDE